MRLDLLIVTLLVAHPCTARRLATAVASCPSSHTQSVAQPRMRGDGARPTELSLMSRRAASGCVLAALVLPSASVATLPPDTSGTWAIDETRGGQQCTATLMLQPTRAPLSAAEMRRGAARYQGVCVDSADGSWLVQEGAAEGAPPRLAWRLEYEKSTVFFSFEVKENGGGRLSGRGDVFAAPRSDPSGLRRVGSFTAKRVSTDWDLTNPVIARRVTEKLL